MGKQNKEKISKKKLWIAYLSVAVAVCVVGGVAYAFSRMDKSNNKTGDETTSTTVTRETSKTTEIVTSATEDKAIVTVTSASETKISETLKIEETQTDNHEDVEKYIWLTQPVYYFDDLEPIVDVIEYRKNILVYCDAFKAEKDGKFGLVDIDGNIKQELIYDDIISIGRRGPNGFVRGYETKIGEEYRSIDVNYNDIVTYGSSVDGCYMYYDVDTKKPFIYWTNEGEAWNEEMIAGKVYVVEYAKNITPTNASEMIVSGDVYEGIGQFALFKDNQMITNEFYTSATDLVDNCIAFEKEGKWGYLNEKGEQILPFEFDTAYGNLIKYSDKIDKEYPFICTEGIIAVFKDGQCGYYDNKGNVIVEMGVFEDIAPVKNGKAFVKKDDKWGIIEINK